MSRVVPSKGKRSRAEEGRFRSEPGLIPIMPIARPLALPIRLFALLQGVPGAVAAGLMVVAVVFAPLTVDVLSDPAAAKDHGGGNGGGEGHGGGHGGGGKDGGPGGKGGDRGGSGRGGGSKDGPAASQGPAATAPAQSKSTQNKSNTGRLQGAPFSGNSEPAGEALSAEEEAEAIKSGWE